MEVTSGKINKLVVLILTIYIFHIFVVVYNLEYTYLLLSCCIRTFFIYVAEVPCGTVNDCSSCANISGRETCFCMPGYQLDIIDNVTCLGMIP